ncbi:MAG: hypothetical protein A2W80_09580 [Candidatus Riflebacteria bacterium GWC2_50_8]|nr:MAG: hypothetical protein A2W80_09580 [Candidatus Riflebacteria bacterium GWC2_50_8]
MLMPVQKRTRIIMILRKVSRKTSGKKLPLFLLRRFLGDAIGLIHGKMMEFQLGLPKKENSGTGKM